MRLRLCAAVVAAALGASGCSNSVGNVEIDTSSKEGLTETLENVKADHGDEAAKSIIEDIGFIVGDYFSDEQLDKAYAQGDVNGAVEKLDDLRNQALKDIDGLTVKELREKAKPLEHEYRLERKEKAQARLPAFEEEKARVMKVQSLHDNLQLLDPKIIRDEDEFGYMEPVFSVKLKNDSDLTLRALDLEVAAWSTIDTSVEGASQIRLTFADSPVEPGDSVDVNHAVSPMSDLAAAAAQGAGQGTKMELLVVYSAEEGRIEMNGSWTDEMEANLKTLREYASYEGE